MPDLRESTAPAGASVGSTAPSRATAWLLLALILAVGGALRFWNIDAKTPFIWDHGIYWLEAKWYASAAQAVAGSLERLAEERRTGEDIWKLDDELERIRAETPRYFPWAGRPVQPMIMAAMMLLGDEDNRALGVYVAATAALGTAVAMFVFAGRVYGRLPAVMCALVAVFSGYSLQYSIQAWLESLMALSFIPVMGLWYRSLREDNPNPLASLAWSGFLFGVAVVVAIRILSMVIILPPLELLVWWNRGPRRISTLAKRALVFGGAAVIAPALAEVPYHIAYVAAPFLDQQMTLPTYWTQALGMVLYGATEGGITPGVRLGNLPAFPYYLARLDLVVALLGAAGIAQSIRRRSLADGVALSWFLVGFAYLTFNNARPRYLMLSMPALYLMAAGLFAPGAWLDPFARDAAGRARRRWALGAVVLAVVASGLVYRALAEPRTRTCYAEAIAYMRDHQGIRHVTNLLFNDVQKTYAGEGNVYPDAYPPEVPPADVAELRALYDEGYRYYLVDFFRYAYRNFIRNKALNVAREPVERADAFLTEIERTVEPVFTCENPAGAAWPVQHEVNKSFKHARMLTPAEREASAWIRVYDIGAYLRAVGAEGEGRAPVPEPSS